jgi:hypothetical protein
MWGFFSLGLVFVASAIAWLLRRYAAPSVPYIVLATTAYAWAVSMSIVLITPVDVAATLMYQPEPAVSVFWKITYWSTQVGGGVMIGAKRRRSGVWMCAHGVDIIEQICDVMIVMQQGERVVCRSKHLSNSREYGMQQQWGSAAVAVRKVTASWSLKYHWMVSCST